LHSIFATIAASEKTGGDTGNFGVPLWWRLLMAQTHLMDRLDAAIAERNLLNHPFYQDWQAGKLSRESLQLYASQYYRHVEAFPKHLRVRCARRRSAT
jgi:pyrroloquinoline quinone (PQQ) biosynthesis protein C